MKWTLANLFLTLHTISVAAASAVHLPSKPRQASSAGLNVPSSNQFISRNYHAGVVLGSYLYIDGGDISYNDNNGIFHHVPDNNTYAIDLTQDWTNDTSVLIPIEKSAPVFCYGHLLADEAQNVIYSFGGAQCVSLTVAQSPPLPPTSLWRFTPSGSSGSGSWAEVADVHGLNEITRPAGAASTYGGGSAFLLGGVASSRTSSETSSLLSVQPLPGLLTYNYSTNTFTNSSATNFSTYGTSEFGGLHFISGMNGHKGLLAAIGGDHSGLVTWTDNGGRLRDFSTIHVYNPSTGQWMNQTASGSIPEPRDRFCTVGVEGDNGTYEIFIFGGHIASTTGDPEASANPAMAAENLLRDEVFVLTIPGFNWQKANYLPTWPRFGHTCNVIGKRQMIVVGGLNPTATSKSALKQQQDPWPNGIGIFDLTEMQWADKYDSNAEAYITPKVVKMWYKNNEGYFPQTWDDPALEMYFTGKNGTTSATSPSSSASTAAPTSSASTTSAANSSSSSNNSIGPIVGGVVGGIGGALVIVGFLWFFLRRRRQTTRKAADAISLHSREDDREPIVAASAMAEKPLPAELADRPGRPSDTATYYATGGGDSKEQWSDSPGSTLRSPASPRVVEAPTSNGRVELEA